MNILKSYLTGMLTNLKRRNYSTAVTTKPFNMAYKVNNKIMLLTESLQIVGESENNVNVLIKKIDDMKAEGYLNNNYELNNVTHEHLIKALIVGGV